MTAEQLDMWIAAQLDKAPPLTPEQSDLIVRVFARSTTDAGATPATDAA